jgi:hypothetical protein
LTEGSEVATDGASVSSGLIGDAVFYDPDGDGPYADGRTALEDVPPGGTFVIGHGTWDVAEEGRLLIEKTVNVRGMGWTSSKEEPVGTRIVNTGDTAVDEPAVEFRGPEDIAENNPRILGSIREINVVHEGSAPAVRCVRAIRTHIADCKIECRRQAPIGIEYDTWGFFATANRNVVTGARDICVNVGGGGYAHEFYSNHFATNVDGAIAFQTEQMRTILVGGECASTGENGTAIRFQGPYQGPYRGLTGGYVVEPGIEATAYDIDIGGTHGDHDSGLVRDVQLYHVTLNPQELGVRFGNAENCHLIRPNIAEWVGRAGTDSVLWTEQSADCGVVATPGAMKRMHYSNDGGENPYIHVSGALSKEELDQMSVGVPTTVGYAPDYDSPVFHNGEEWKRVATETIAPSTE